MEGAEKEEVSEFLKKGLGHWRGRSLSLRSPSSLSQVSALSESEAFLQKDVEGLNKAKERETKLIENDRVFFANLTAAPPSALIHLIIEYHDLLIESGQEDKAKQISQSLAKILESRLASLGPERNVQGVDLLLKDGLMKFLLRVNPHLPQLKSQIIRFKDVTYSAVKVIPEGFETLGTKAMDIASGPLKNKPKTVEIDLLKNVSGYLMPGTLTLVLGPPGSGKNCLHKILSGRLPPGAGKLSGSVTYNGKTADEIIVRRLIGVVDAHDYHIPFLTVKETMEISRDFTQFWTFKNYGPEMKEIVSDLLEKGQDPKLEMTLSMVGLSRVAQRLAGSPVIPTTTAGERHRLSVGEVLAGTYASYFFDELNAGTDPKASYELALAILIFSRVRGASCMLSLLQPSPETFHLCDRLILLNNGRVVYQGARREAIPYFAKLGYVKPDHMEAAEFLQEVTTESGATYLQSGFERLDVPGFAAAFENSDLFKHIVKVVDSPDLFLEVAAEVENGEKLGIQLSSSAEGAVVKTVNPDSAVSQVSLTQTGTIIEGDKIVSVCQKENETSSFVENLPAEDIQALLDKSQGPLLIQTSRPFVEPESVAAAQFEQEYIHSVWFEMWHLTKRNLTVQWRNKFTLYARIIQIVFLSLYTGLLFFQMPKDANPFDAGLRRGVGFVSIMTNTLLNLGQFPGLLDERQVYYKQHAARFYRPFSYWFSLFAGGSIYSLAEATLWSLVVYFLSGLSLSGGGQHFWIYYLIICLIALNGSSMVRFIAFLAPDIGVASAISGVFIALYVIFAGFVIGRLVIPNYWSWVAYINPLQWAITAILINEFNSSVWGDTCTPDVAKTFTACRGRIGQSLGSAYLASGQFLKSTHWIGLAVVVLFLYIVLWNLLAYRLMAAVRHGDNVEDGKLPEKGVKAVHEGEDIEGEVPKQSESTIPFEPVTLSWYDLSYSVFVPQISQTKSIFKDISGWAKPGEMLALLGLSGAGKTTLLDCLAGRYVDPTHIEGEILVNGYPREDATFSRVVGFVDSKDSYWPFSTVREALEFNAAMRLGKEFGKEQRSHFVDQVLTLMELKHLENNLVVSLGHSLAVEQSRRVTIAIELAGNPSILLVDEPTQGLDSVAALKVIQCLKRVAASGRTLMATLHRPSLRQVSLFDTAMILKRGGESAYFGPVGFRCLAIQTYFEYIPGTPKCDPNVDALSYAYAVIGDGISDNKVTRRDYAFEYQVSSLALQNTETLDALKKSKGTAGPKLTKVGYGAGSFLQAKETIFRLQKQYWRNLHYSLGRFLSAILLGLIVGSVFYKTEITMVAGMNARAGQIFLSLLLFGVANAGGVIPQINAAWSAYRRERSLKLYTPLWYNLSWGLAEIPYLFSVTLIFAGISFGMSGLGMDSAAQFFQLWFIFAEFVLCITFLAIFLATCVTFPPLASVVVPVIISVMIPTGGLVIPKQKISSFFIWVYWLNPFQYALNSMTSVTFYCDVNSAQCMNNGLNLLCAMNPVSCPSCTCPRLSDGGNTFVWSQIQATRSLDSTRIGLDMLALALYTVLFRTLSYVALKYLKHNQRK